MWKGGERWRVLRGWSCPVGVPTESRRGVEIRWVLLWLVAVTWVAEPAGVRLPVMSPFWGWCAMASTLLLGAGRWTVWSVLISVTDCSQCD